MKKQEMMSPVNILTSKDMENTPLAVYFPVSQLCLFNKKKTKKSFELVQSNILVLVLSRSLALILRISQLWCLFRLNYHYSSEALFCGHACTKEITWASVSLLCSWLAFFYYLFMYLFIFILTHSTVFTNVLCSEISQNMRKGVKWSAKSMTDL